MGGVSNPTASSDVEVETPTGTINGTNTVFNTSKSYQADSTVLSLNGAELLEGSGNQYTESADKELTLTEAPIVGDVLSVLYKRVLG